MPLFLSVMGRKRGSKDSGNRGYVKYENGNNNKPSTTRTNRFNRFNRFMSVRDLETLPEALDLFTIKEGAAKDDDDVRLVEGRKKPGEILVTNQILVSDGAPRSVETDSGELKPWDAHAPPTAHLR